MSAPGPVDTDSVDLGNGDSTSITLSWDTDVGDEGDWDAVADSAFDADATPITVDVKTVSTIGTAPAAVGATSRAAVSYRETSGIGSGVGVSSRELAATRSLTPGVAPVTLGSTRRTAAATRAAIGRGVGGGVTTRSTSATRSTTAGTAPGSGTVRRLLAAARSTAAGVAPGTLGATTRTVTAIRTARGGATGSGAVTRLHPAAYALPIDDAADTVMLLTVREVATDHDELTITGQVTRDLLETGALDHYRDAGDVVRESSAFGAYRRIPRDGTDPVTVEPPNRLSPPFERREIVPLDANIDQISSGWHDVQLTLGLVEPRAREPIEAESESEQIGSSTLTLDAGETGSITISGTAPSTLGDYLATVRTDIDEDTALVSVTDADVVISWPVATLGLTERQVGQIQRAPDSGRERVTLPVRLTAEQAAILVAAGSRVEAVRTRQTPDARNQLRDTLPNEELTADINTTDAFSSGLKGEVVLVDWSLTWARPTSHPIDADLTFVSLD